MTPYDLAYYSASPLFVPLLAWRWAKRGKYRQSTGGMFGRDLPTGEAARPFANGSVWIHAVSVGETMAAKAVEPGLRGVFPDLPFVVSTVTETGQEAARKGIPGAEAFTYLPADFSWNVARAFDTFHPRVLAIMETELWPNFITMAAARGTRVFLLNAKLSDRSYPRYKFFSGPHGPLGPMFRALDGVCAQTPEIAERFRGLGIPADRVRVTGNVKFDLKIDPVGPAERAEWRARLGLTVDQPVIIAGSTHPGEEEPIFRAFREARARVPNCALILVPRHINRSDEIHKWLTQGEGAVVRRSSLAEGPASPEVVLMDEMGKLTRAYGLADVAIVAGSFCPVGGHNIMEPAAHGVPVIYGPDMHSQREMAQIFKTANAGRQVEFTALAAALIDLLENPAAREREGAQARELLAANQGSSARTAAAIAEWMQGV